MGKATLFNISGPYGAGKDSILNLLITSYPERIHRVGTLTTRPVSLQADPSYVHAEPEEFFKQIASGDWIYNEQLGGAAMYATNIAEIRRAITDGYICVHSIYAGPTGAGRLREIFGEELLSIALLPPGESLQDQVSALRDRLHARARDDTAALTARETSQNDSIAYIRQNPQVITGTGLAAVFDDIVINDDLSIAWERISKTFVDRCLG